MHVDPAVVAMVRQAVPATRLLLVTDAMAAAGAADGEYLLGEVAVQVRAGVARRRDGNALAGSTLTMDAAVRRAVVECGFSVPDAVLAAATTPARLLGLGDRGALEVGRRGDLVLLDDDLELQEVWQAGAAVLPRGGDSS